MPDEGFAFAVSDAEKGGLVLEGATILSGPKWQPAPDSSVLVAGDRIEAVARAGELRHPGGARVIDCKGKFLLPGFIDMHTHCLTLAATDFLAQFGPRLEGVAHREWFLRLFLAYGVTTVRDIGNYAEILELKRAGTGGTIAPSIVAAGELLEGPEPLWPLGRRVTTVESAREEVRRQRDMGADWVKLYAGLAPDAAEAAIDEAHELGMRAAGHLGRTTATQAARMGIDTLEHTTTLVDEGFLSEQDRASLPPPDDLKSRRERNRGIWTRADMDSEAAMDLMTALRESRTAVCPTLIVHETTTAGPDKAYRDFAFDHAPQRWLETWEGRFKVFNPGGEPAPDAQAGMRKALDLIHLLHVTGVRILVGTDAALWNPYVVPGASIHREMELLAAAGLKPEAVLSSVTCVAAEALSPERGTGVVGEGMRADLVLLNGNPLEDIRRTREIELVVNRGHAFTPEDVLKSMDSPD